MKETLLALSLALIAAGESLSESAEGITAPEAEPETPAKPTAAQKKAAAAAKKEAAAAKGEDPEALRAEVRKLAVSLSKDHGDKDGVTAILADEGDGASKLSDLEEDNLAAVRDALAAAIEAADL